MNNTSHAASAAVGTTTALAVTVLVWGAGKLGVDVPADIAVAVIGLVLASGHGLAHLLGPKLGLAVTA